MTSTFATSPRPLTAAIALALGAGNAHATLTLTVTTGGDAGTPNTCTLRQAIESANNDDAGASSCAAGSGNDTIVFDAALADTTVTLSQGQLVVSSPLTISGNGQTIDAGGASRVFYLNTATFTANSVTLTGGAAPPGGFGGGILSNAGTITLANTTVSGNLALKGGGIYAASGTVALTNCTISGNTGIFDGGGLFAGNTVTATLGNDTIGGNTAGFHGGGVYAALDTFTLMNTTISGNAATQGAGVWTAHSTGTITDSNISGNTLGMKFGGIYAAYGNLTLTNTTVAGNTVTDVGGGVYVAHGTATFTNTTISGNASQATGGVGVQTGTVTFVNTILANNTGGDCSSAGNDTIVVASHSLVADAASACGIAVGGAAGNIVGQDPLLAPPGNNGGPTQTMALDAVSPAINAGSVALALLGNDTLNYDQRGYGFPRTLDAKVDMGAYQHQGDRLFADGSEPEP